MANRVIFNMTVIVTVFVLYSFYSFVVVVHGDFNIYPIILTCNRNKIQATDFFYVVSLDNVLSVLPKTDPEDLRSVKGRYFWSKSNGVGCFGHASCENSLADIDCTQCVRMAAGLAPEKCPASIGAKIQLPKCEIRYEAYYFTE